MKGRSTYSAAYTDILFHPNDGTESKVIATVVDPYLADCIAAALNHIAFICPHTKRQVNGRLDYRAALTGASHWATSTKQVG